MQSLVSIIMLSRNRAHFLEASINSIKAQTYKNWELLFVDDASSDDTIQRIIELRDDKHDFRITQCVFSRGEMVNRNSVIKDAHGKWIAFLDAGDVWEPTKLEKQVRFMEMNDYVFSYTLFNSIDEKGNNQGIVLGGPETITKSDMKKCCWMGYLTVMYDREKIGILHVQGIREANDYPLWLLASKKADCHLLPECLASQMSVKGLWNRLRTSDKWVWRFESYRKIEEMNPVVSAYMALRNLVYTAYKWWKYAKKN